MMLCGLFSGKPDAKSDAASSKHTATVHVNDAQGVNGDSHTNGHPAGHLSAEQRGSKPDVCPFAPGTLGDLPANKATEVQPVDKRALSLDAQVELVLQELKRTPKCPFGHGSVGTGPFPGYVHGKHPTVCKNGCTPDPELDKYGKKSETPIETLVREALEYQDLYHRERGNSEEVKQARIVEILAEIKEKGIYTHTFDELQHGGRVAWRNAPKCSNRKFWEELCLIDRRDANTPEDMYKACLDLLEVATLSCVTTANIVVFRPQTPGTTDGPRVWNTQLIRYTGYKQPDGTIFGEKAEAAFTTMLQETFGWVPPPPEKRTAYDVLPLVLQAHPDEEPEVFELPPHYVARVPITHPEHPQITELGLQWYAVPAVSCLELSVGGLTYTAIPFNGWYAVTEIVRNLTEEGRYDMCEPVAKKLGIDTRSDYTMWRDAAIVAITQAVMHSFRLAGYGMVDHHTLMKNFWGWYHKEKERRGYCPGNWKWIIPPVSPTASPCYLRLNEMTEFTIKPGFWYAPMWRKYLERLQQLRTAKGLIAGGPAVLALPAAGGQEAATAVADVSVHDGAAAKKARIMIAYASVTGTTAKYAEALTALLADLMHVKLFNMEDFEPDSWTENIEKADCVVLMTCTYGPGAPPSTANKFLAWVQRGLAIEGEAKEAFSGRNFSVVGFGSTSYPRFCAAADQLYTLISATGALPMGPLTKVDALSHEEVSVWNWARAFGEQLVRKEIISQAEKEKVLAALPMTDDGTPKPFVQKYTLIDLSGVEGVKAAHDRFRMEATVIEVKDLKLDSAKAKTQVEALSTTKQIAMDVSHLTGLSYLAGDELAVWGENPQDAVEAVAGGLGLKDLDALFLLQRTTTKPPGERANQGGNAEDADEEGDATGLSCAPFPLPNSYRTVLSRYVGVCDVPSFEAICALSKMVQDPRLSDLASSYSVYQKWATSQGIRWADMFTEFPALIGLPVPVFLQLVPIIKPRHYSISSSASHVPGQLHLTISRLAYSLPTGKVRHGFCSSFMSTRQPGDKVSIKVLPTPGFRMPMDPSAPVVMVAAGAGIAPFKGFWEERLARAMAGQDEAHGGVGHGFRSRKPQQMGPAVLLFGCRSSTDDYLYCDKIQDVNQKGALSHVFTAFSREPGGKKMYVQDAVTKNAEDLKPLLLQGSCHVYVCGSSNMAQEVQMAFAKVLGADAYRNLVQEGRYHEDVFGMVVPNHGAAVREAAAKGSLNLLAKATPEEVLEMLQSGSLLIDSTDHSSATLLHIAARAGNKPLAAMLLEQPNVPLNMLDMYGCTPLQAARLAGHIDIAGLIKAKGGNLVSRLVALYYPLHAAVMEGNIAKAKELVSQGADLRAVEYHGLTPLHVACAVATPEVIQYLISAGSPLDTVTRQGLLPLQLALALQRTEAAKLLQAAKAPLVAKQHVADLAKGVKGKTSTYAGTPAVSGIASIGNLGWDRQGTQTLLEVTGMTEPELEALVASWSYLSGSAFPAGQKAQLENFGVDFFLCLFEQCPILLKLFPFKDEQGKPIIAELKVHGLKVVQMLGVVVDLMANFNALQRALLDLIERHIAYGVEFAHYEIVMTALTTTLTQALGPAMDSLAISGWNKTAAMIIATAEQVYDERDKAVAAVAAAAAAAPAEEASA